MERLQIWSELRDDVGGDRETEAAEERVITKPKARGRVSLMNGVGGDRAYQTRYERVCEHGDWGGLDSR
jgi:hypothetical protein